MQTSANAVMCVCVLEGRTIKWLIWMRGSNVTAFKMLASLKGKRRVAPDDVNGAFPSWALS